MMNDPYSILGVSRGASDKEIKRAYRNLSRRYHPDSFANSPRAEAEAAAEKFKQIQEAYNQIVSERSGQTSGNYGYGGYGRNGAGQSYSEEDQHLMAAMNYIRARRFNEALHVLDGIENHNARWYYFSSVANMGLGNNVTAKQHIEQAVRLEPSNMEYRQFMQHLAFGGTWYQSMGQGYERPYAGTGNWCLSMLFLNMLCNCCFRPC